MREHNEAVNRLDFLAGRAPITVDYEPGTVEIVEQHDGSRLALRKLGADYDLHDRYAAMNFLHKHAAEGQIVTGSVLCRRPARPAPRSQDRGSPLNALGEDELCPGSPALEKINASLR